MLNPFRTGLGIKREDMGVNPDKTDGAPQPVGDEELQDVAGGGLPKPGKPAPPAPVAPSPGGPIPVPYPNLP